MGCLDRDGHAWPGSEEPLHGIIGPFAVSVYFLYWAYDQE